MTALEPRLGGSAWWRVSASWEEGVQVEGCVRFRYQDAIGVVVTLACVGVVSLFGLALLFVGFAFR